MTKTGEQEERADLDVQVTSPELNTWKINLLSPVIKMHSRRLLNSTFDFYLSAKQIQLKDKFCL